MLLFTYFLSFCFLLLSSLFKKQEGTFVVGLMAVR